MQDQAARRESRLRSEAQRQGLRLQKCRSRNPENWLYGTYHLVDASTNAIVASGTQNGFGLTLDDVEDALNE